MALYMLFAGLGILIYARVALAATAIASFSGAHVFFGLQFAFFVSLLVFLEALILFYADRILREHSSSLGRASVWRRCMVVAALVFYAGDVSILIAGTREPGDALTCAGQCGAGGEPVAGEASIASPNGSHVSVVGSESARALAAGRTLFRERGCVGCHEPDQCGVGPTLYGLFGRPVQDSRRGVAIVDESYVREAILNPSATVAVGFPDIMPTFAGQLTEEELQALIVYVKSLSVPVQVQRRLAARHAVHYLRGSCSRGRDPSASRRAARVATPSLGKARWR